MVHYKSLLVFLGVIANVTLAQAAAVPVQDADPGRLDRTGTNGPSPLYDRWQPLPTAERRKSAKSHSGSGEPSPLYPSPLYDRWQPPPPTAAERRKSVKSHGSGEPSPLYPSPLYDRWQPPPTAERRKSAKSQSGEPSPLYAPDRNNKKSGEPSPLYDRWQPIAERRKAAKPESGEPSPLYRRGPDRYKWQGPLIV